MKRSALQRIEGPESGAAPVPTTTAAADALGEVFSAVSHDLRDPLSAIVMGTQLLLGGPQDDRSRRVLEAIARAGERMSVILRNAATLRAPTLELRSRPEKAVDVVSSACAKVEALALRKGATIERRIELGSATIDCDAARIEEILLIVGDNAVRHANGRPVVISASIDAGRLCLSVRDEGRGIPPDRLATIFDWHTNALQPLREGTGLGLAAARRIVEAHGGRLEARSKVGQGTSLVVSIPLVRAVGAGTQRDEGVGPRGQRRRPASSTPSPRPRPAQTPSPVAARAAHLKTNARRPDR